jgi:hypothetical protein
MIRVDTRGFQVLRGACDARYFHAAIGFESKIWESRVMM